MYGPPYGPPYSYYPPPHHLYGGQAPVGAAPGLPPLPRGRGAGGAAGYDDAVVAAATADEAPPAGNGDSIDLTVLGSNRPFAAAAPGGGRPGSAAALAAAAAMYAEGQEQVNILNLPLPEMDAQVWTCRRVVVLQPRRAAWLPA